MAAHIVRQLYLFCRSARTDVVLLQVKQKTLLNVGVNNHLQLRVGFGTRETDNEQGVQVLVPVDRLTVSYSRSSGPGGQNVNKVSTKAEVRFHVLTADWIPEDVRRKVFDQNKNRITKAGELLVTSELSRSQHRNLSDCVQKISAIIAEASKKPHEPTVENVALWAARSEKRNKERLKQKKINSTIKQSRRDFD
ncbi:peptidyl-tRNA hydrolase ICT1, mitochondrial [Solea senegalensis]|uniref:Large ribosomal subunit protein mL62 n=1 Tax=Solea senegalensis TaxID=28829 RepID=A0AAV6RT64_SOLSE|nr:peptidyl-tRNA hydrolase ICT1, mitochondrial [Solea senegalensis]KAG7507769.1 peptidyl-tRNA hydrolase ICT1, mitochondrial [Solea senegalensis]